MGMIPLLMALALLTPTCPAPIDATLVRVIDADTLELDARPWPEVTIRARIRISGLWSPERYTVAGKAATLAAQVLVPVGARVTLRLTGAKSFDRFVGHVCVGAEDFAATMIKLGYGTVTR
jgi:endonuclease YncB( thermonuclease family)